MPTSSIQTLTCKSALVKPIIASDYDVIRSTLDNLLPAPLWSETVEMTHHLALHVNGAYFEYEPHVGWYYTEDGS